MSDEQGVASKRGGSYGDESCNHYDESPVDTQRIVPNNDISHRPFTSDAANNYYNAMTKRSILTAPSKERKKKGLLGKIKWKGGKKGKKMKADNEGKIQMEVINEGDEADDCSDEVGPTEVAHILRDLSIVGSQRQRISKTSDTINKENGAKIINDNGGDYRENGVNATKNDGDCKNARGRNGDNGSPNESVFKRLFSNKVNNGSETTSDGENCIFSDASSGEPPSQPPFHQDSSQILQGGQEAKNCEDMSDSSNKSNRSSRSSKSKRCADSTTSTGHQDMHVVSSDAASGNESNKLSLEDRSNNAPHASLDEEGSVRSTKSNQSAKSRGTEASKESTMSAKSSHSGRRPLVRGQTASSSDKSFIFSGKSSCIDEPEVDTHGDRSDHVIHASSSKSEKSNASKKSTKSVTPHADQGTDSCSTESGRSTRSTVSRSSKRSIKSVKSGGSNGCHGQSDAISVRSERSTGSRHSIKSSKSSSGQKLLDTTYAKSPRDSSGKTSSSVTGCNNDDTSSVEHIVISCDSSNGDMEVELSISSGENDQKEDDIDNKCEVASHARVEINASKASTGRDGSASAVSKKGLEQLLTEALAMSLTPEGIAQYLMEKGGSTAVDEFLLITRESDGSMKKEDRDRVIPPVTSFEKAEVVSATSSVTQNTGRSVYSKMEGSVRGKIHEDSDSAKDRQTSIEDEEDHEKDDVGSKNSDASTAALSNLSSEEGRASPKCSSEEGGSTKGQSDNSDLSNSKERKIDSRGETATAGGISTLKRLKKKLKGDDGHDTKQDKEPAKAKRVKSFESPIEADLLTPPHVVKECPKGNFGHGPGEGGVFNIEHETETGGKNDKSALSKLKGKLMLSSNREGGGKQYKGCSANALVGDTKVNTVASLANSSEGETKHATLNMETDSDALSSRSDIAIDDEAALIDPLPSKSAEAADGTLGEGRGQEIQQHPSTCFACGIFEMFGAFSPKPTGGGKSSILPVSSFEQPLKEPPPPGPALDISDSSQSNKEEEDSTTEKWCGFDDSTVISWKDLDQSGLCV